MTISPEKIGAADADDERFPTATTAPATPKAPATSTAPAATTPWWRRSWIIPLFAVVLFYLYYQEQPFVGVPPSQVPVSPHPGFTAYYPVLLVHMTAGTIAMLTACLQVWQSFRRRFPKAHRIAGRLYIFAGAIPGGIAGWIIVWFAPASGKLGVMFAVTGWMVTAIVAYVAVRRHNYALHRRYMLYSFAFVMNNIWGVFFAIVWTKLNLTWDFTYLAEAARWVGWTVNLALVEWWLHRTAKRPVY